eukprot:CAMPEP_0179135506 /NCGR_PEP_ID=MMETSP0796-20121207/64521_1 /TAXON_ID=73915 /ORGANISM="Pyrodinium bahamense, Strain pbaha01" /LENGTH=35 /DNA_ID= /DNA_START= /DNA_END= /DNA_ORIENTATION=
MVPLPSSSTSKAISWCTSFLSSKANALMATSSSLE